MSLTNALVQANGKLPEFFESLIRGQAPDHFTVQHLKDIGFNKSSDRALIPLLKALGFLSEDGRPTQRYTDYRDRSRSRQVMGHALRDSYADIFVLRAIPTEEDKEIFEGKFKSVHNTSDRMAKLMTNTFLTLLNLADLESPKQTNGSSPELKIIPPVEIKHDKDDDLASDKRARHTHPTLHYNIQIHLPATKDVDVFNAIFRSLKEHLLD